MTNRFGRHYIAGCEADRPRPMVYIHAGWRQKRFRRAGGTWIVLSLGLAGAVLVLSAIGAVLAQ